MKISNLVLLAFAKALAHADCFNSGPDVEKGVVDFAVPTVCSIVNGHFVKGEWRRQCVTDKNNVRWDFQLKYKGGKEQDTIDGIECANGFMKELKCKHGGKTGYKNWEYTADPNNGNCIGIVVKN
ncbi:hypothetical protein VTL71DRAFT_4452 [Oculimacula yallundae]|uniref:Uncharacterized protein n=1 Tax=Oculimacula yallundae TaxID=86028 RepID=A0ABR4C1Z3_9HELO